jgi:hypothetical protein
MGRVKGLVSTKLSPRVDEINAPGWRLAARRTPV